MTNKLYTERNAEQLEPYYSRHVLAMTVEKLHYKSSIAAELAWRDKEIQRLSKELAIKMMPKKNNYPWGEL